jgi:hypothetical protein
VGGRSIIVEVGFLLFRGHRCRFGSALGEPVAQRNLDGSRRGANIPLARMASGFDGLVGWLYICLEA